MKKPKYTLKRIQPQAGLVLIEQTYELHKGWTTNGSSPLKFVSLRSAREFVDKALVGLCYAVRDDGLVQSLEVKPKRCKLSKRKN